MNILLVLPLLFSLPMISACSTLSVEDGAAIRASAVKDEISVGKAISDRLLGRFGNDSRDAAALRYVNLVGQSLALSAGRPELTFHFAILDTSRVAAYAAPGGFVLVTRGMLGQLRAESELAVVLAHEIAHVNERHLYRRIAPVGDGTRRVSEGLRLLLETGLGDEEELQADEAGLFYAATAGYDPSAMSLLLGRLEKSRAGRALEKTQPSFDERLTAVKRFLERNGFIDAISGDRGSFDGRFREALGHYAHNGRG